MSNQVNNHHKLYNIQEQRNQQEIKQTQFGYFPNFSPILKRKGNSKECFIDICIYV